MSRKSEVSGWACPAADLPRTRVRLTDDVTASSQWANFCHAKTGQAFCLKSDLSLWHAKMRPWGSLFRWADNPDIQMHFNYYFFFFTIFDIIRFSYQYHENWRVIALHQKPPTEKWHHQGVFFFLSLSFTSWQMILLPAMSSSLFLLDDPLKWQ